MFLRAPFLSPEGRTCRGSAALEQCSIVLRAGAGGSYTCRGEKQHHSRQRPRWEASPDAATASLQRCVCSVGKQRSVGAGGTAPHHPHGASRLATPRLTGRSRGIRAAGGLSKAIRSLPAFSPPGCPQRSGGHRPRPSFTKWRRLFVCRHRAPQLSPALPETGPRVRSHPALRGEGPHRC